MGIFLLFLFGLLPFHFPFIFALLLVGWIVFSGDSNKSLAVLSFICVWGFLFWLVV